MKEVGELVVYGASGVCRIEAIREEVFSGSVRHYYILQPVATQNNSRIFVPADNEKLVSQIKQILSPNELYALVQEATPFSEPEWAGDGRARSKLCRDILANGDRERLVRMIKTVYQQGRTPTSSEESVCLRAAIMLYQEFSLVLELEKADVIPFVLGQKQFAVKE
jgi:CarD family transcriptional regulator